MAASKRGHEVTAELLLLAGADYFLRNQVPHLPALLQ